jgi:hypothetical protein
MSQSIAASIGDFAEQQGAFIASVAIKRMTSATTQAERVSILRGALIDLHKTQHHYRASGGFSAVMTCFFERGMEVAA